MNFTGPITDVIINLFGYAVFAIAILVAVYLLVDLFWDSGF
jgi:hypothetical protein